MIKVDTVLDASGLICPLPILRLKKKMQTMDAGSMVQLITTDASSANDIAAFCQLTRNILIDAAEASDRWVFIIQKGDNTNG